MPFSLLSGEVTLTNAEWKELQALIRDYPMNALKVPPHEGMPGRIVVFRGAPQIAGERSVQITLVDHGEI